MKKDKVITKEKNRLLKITDFSIPYIKELKQLPLVKSTNACLLMQQLEYWFMKYPKGFYKFLARPDSLQYAYENGKSWAEELAISVDEYRTAFDQIGIRYKSKKEYDKAKAFSDEFQGKYYCSYFNKVSRLTYYFRNHKTVEKAIDFVERLPKLSSKDSNFNLTESAMPIPKDEEYQFIEDEFVYPESTETTTKITSDIYQERELSDDNQNSLLNNNFDIEKEIINNQFSDVIDDVKSFDDSEIDCNQYSAPSRPAEKILIPLDFVPTLEAQYKAISKFPNVSPAYVTKKLIRDSHQQGKKKTISEWHFKWWDWMNTERPSPNNSDLETEHSAIINKVMNDIYDASYNCGKYLFTDADLHLYLKEEYSEETIIEVIKRLFTKDYFARIGNYYFNFKETSDSKEWSGKVAEQILDKGLDDEPIEIFSRLLNKASLNQLDV